jgi:hypothetical protein
MKVVSPLVAIPSGATYCHSGPSWSIVQLTQVAPSSREKPQPFPTVPYQISSRGPNAKAWTKSHEIEVAVVSRVMCSQLVAPGRNRKMPRP